MHEGTLRSRRWKIANSPLKLEPVNRNKRRSASGGGTNFLISSIKSPSPDRGGVGGGEKRLRREGRDGLENCRIIGRVQSIVCRRAVNDHYY